MYSWPLLTSLVRCLIAFLCTLFDSLCQAIRFILSQYKDVFRQTMPAFNSAVTKLIHNAVEATDAAALIPHGELTRLKSFQFE